MIDEIYLDTFYKGYCNSLVYNKTKQEELLSEFYIKILELKENKPNRVKDLIDNKEFKYYAIAIIRNLVYNKKSSFNKNNNNFVELTETHEQVEDKPIYFNSVDSKRLLKDIKGELSSNTENNEGDWYNEMIFNIYFNEFNSYRKMSKATKIPVSSIRDSVEIVKNNLKIKLGNRYNNLKSDLVF